MKTYTKKTPAQTTSRTLLQTNLMILSCIMLQSCIMTTVVQEIEDIAATQQEHYTTKTETIYEGLLTLQIQNNAENTMLQIDSLEICNTQLMDSSCNSITLIKTPIQLHYGTHTSITHHCRTGISTHEVKIHGTLYSYLPNNETYSIYSGTMYYPISGEITDTTTSVISIHPNCTLYACINGKMTKVLQPITFSASVNDWD